MYWLVHKIIYLQVPLIVGLVKKIGEIPRKQHLFYDFQEIIRRMLMLASVFFKIKLFWKPFAKWAFPSTPGLLLMTCAHLLSLRIHWRLIFGNVIRFLHYDFELVILSILTLHLCSFSGFFLWIILNSIKEINRSRKEINGLLSKGISNIYLKVTIEKKWRTQNFEKSSSQGQNLGSSNSRRYHWIFKLLVAT